MKEFEFEFVDLIDEPKKWFSFISMIGDVTEDFYFERHVTIFIG